MNVPELGPRTPRTATAVSRLFGRALLASLRFGFDGTFPDVARGVLVVAPHTSNWDFQVGMGAKFALGLDAHWMGKHTIFRPAPLAALWRATGGIPVDRTSPEKALATVTELFARPQGLILAIAPEGTRYRVERWKSGYHRIARAADVPIVPVAFDWKARLVRLMPAFHATEDYAADTAALMALFHRDMAYRPENFWA